MIRVFVPSHWSYTIEVADSGSPTGFVPLPANDTIRPCLTFTLPLLLTCHWNNNSKMRPPPRNIINLTRSIWSEGPLLGRIPIGQAQEGGLAASRRFSAFTKPCAKSRPKLKSRPCAIQPAVRSSRASYGIRVQSTQHGRPIGSGSSAKRSDTEPLLAAVFGVAALAFVGTSISSHTGVEDHENPIKSDDNVDITDTDGKPSCNLIPNIWFDSNARYLLLQLLTNNSRRSKDSTR